MAQQIQLRNDTAANWTSANPTLAIGEMGVETDTYLFKIGTGADAWNSLAYGGLQGVAGSQVTAGTGAPSNGSGSNGDFYFRTDTMHFYTKAAGTWSDGGTYIGTVPVTQGGTGLTSYTTGDIPYASGSTTIAKLAAGAEGDTIRYQGGVPVTGYIIDPRRESFLFEDFISNSTSALSSGINTTGSSSGLNREGSLETATHLGVYSIQTGSGSASGASYMGWSTSNHGMALGSGICKFEALVRLSRLSTSGQEYIAKFGWFDSVAAPEASTYASMFFYDRATYGDFWVLRTTQSSTSTSTVSSIVPSANTWTRLTILSNSAGTSVAFYVDGVLAGTNSTNIPTGNMGTMIGIHKTNGTGTDSTIAFDYMFQSKIFSSPR